MTYTQFERRYWELYEKSNTYRFGQFFISSFIADSSSTEFQRLWNEWDFSKAQKKVLEIIERYNWDHEDLPVLRNI